MTVLDRSRPFYKVEFFEPDATNPKLIFSPNVFLDTEKPSDTTQVTSEIYISHITTNSKNNGTINTCELELRHGVGGEIPIEINHKVQVYFGFYDQDSSVGPDFSMAYTGFVSRIKNGLHKSLITCKNSLNNIVKKKVKITFSKMMGLDEIIKKFAIELGGLEEAQNGINDPEINKQPGFGISEKKPLLEHLKMLASYGGLDVFTNVFDKFHAIPWDTSKLQDKSSEDTPWQRARNKDESENTDFYKHNILYDEQLIDINFETIADKYSGVEVVGFMPESEEFVHTIDPVKIEFAPDSVDSDDLPLKRYKLTHIIREDAEKIAENLYWGENKLISGSLKLFGHPQIRVGDGVKFDGELLGQTPFRNIEYNDGGTSKTIADTIFQVAQVQHKFDTVEGYVTIIKFVDTHSTAGAGSATGAAAAGGEAGEATAEGGGVGAETVFAGVAARIESEKLLIQITNAQWDKEEARQGDILNLTADVEGAPDGIQGEIEIYEHDVDGIHDIIAKFPVDVINNKIKTTWEYEYHEDTDEIPTDEELKKYGTQYNPPEYFFVVKIGDAEGISGLLTFKDYIEIYLKDEDGEPMADEEYIIQLPDGSEMKGKLDSEGYAKIESIPPGKIVVKFPNFEEIGSADTKVEK